MNLRTLVAVTSSLGIVAFSVHARANSGICDASSTAPQACLDALQTSGRVVNDIFRDVNARTALQLPVYGELVNNWPDCPERVPFSIAGHSIPPYDCPGQYVFDFGVTPTYASASTYVAGVNRQWLQLCRPQSTALVDVGGSQCPELAGAACTTNGDPEHYEPWFGMVFDLGAPSNKVAVFAEVGHGPYVCESIAATVYMSDNPFSREVILDPTSAGIDPNKWNRAVVSKVYTAGFQQVRAPDAVGQAPCGDTTSYSAEEDGFTQVFALPCSRTLRYVSVVSGNDGLDVSECQYNTSTSQIDGVAGLTESGAAVCPDSDHDGFVDCSCLGAPPSCDCNDSDPNVYPDAPESCDAPDLNCDGLPGSCVSGKACDQSQCRSVCSGESSECPAGAACTSTPNGMLCVPQDCTTSQCPAGSSCTAGSCIPSCEGIVCPGTQVCREGVCVDPCAHVQCPSGESCNGGMCQPPCGCFAGDMGCQNGQVCDNGGSNTCVEPLCKNVGCDPNETCDPSTGLCVGFCNAEVVCPAEQKCEAPEGCVPSCQGVVCDPTEVCDLATGLCVSTGGTGGTGGMSGMSGSGGTGGSGGTAGGGTAGAGATGGTGEGGTGTGGTAGATAGGTDGGSSGSAGAQSGSTTSGSAGSSGTSGTSGSGGASASPEDDGSCGCRTAGRDDDRSKLASGLMAFGLALAASRRRWQAKRQIRQ